MWARRLVVIGGAFALAACPEDPTDSGPVLTLSPPAAEVFVADSVQFTATLVDDAGAPITTSFTWSVSDPRVATVSGAGWVRGVAPGAAVIEVTAEGAVATAGITVAADSGQALTIEPKDASVLVYSGVQFSAALVDRHGDTVDAPISWTTTNASVATVDADGRAAGVAPGTVTVRAAARGLSATATLTVEARAAAAVLVGAGDIGDCNTSGDEQTAALLDDIPGIVFTAGDNAYPDATAEEFARCYHPSWGRHKSRTRPAAGNHEYHTFGATAYFDYFGAAAGDPSRGYYSYDAGPWHVIVLNSNLLMTANSPQVQWLRQDLANNRTRCTLAYWHHPRFSSGRHGTSEIPRDAFEALYQANADLIVVGHDHTYERFAPQTPAGQLDMARGIRQIIVGTGGAGLYEFTTIAPNSEVRGNATKGVLKLTLEPDRYRWEFIPVAGGDFTDSGSASCH